MYTLIGEVGLRKGLISEGPSMVLSMLVAEFQIQQIFRAA